MARDDEVPKAIVVREANVALAKRKPDPFAIDDPGSRWYASSTIRYAGLSAGALIAAIVAIADQAAGGIVTALTLAPIAFYAIAKAIHQRGSDPSDEPSPFPRAGEPGLAAINIVLRRIYNAIDPPRDAQLRLTLFLPDDREPLVLRQFARYCESNEPVSAVTVRMGTGDVGLAFTNCRTMHIPDFDQLGGTFAEAMRRLGLEDQEISAHSQRQRKSFYSVPIVDRERHRRMGVLSFDAIPPRFFVEHRSALRRGATREHLVPLLDQVEVAGFKGCTLPDDGVVRDEVAPESDDSAPRGRPPTPRPR